MLKTMFVLQKYLLGQRMTLVQKRELWWITLLVGASDMLRWQPDTMIQTHYASKCKYAASTLFLVLSQKLV